MNHDRLRNVPPYLMRSPRTGLRDVVNDFAANLSKILRQSEEGEDLRIEVRHHSNEIEKLNLSERIVISFTEIHKLRYAKEGKDLFGGNGNEVHEVHLERIEEHWTSILTEPLNKIHAAIEEFVLGIVGRKFEKFNPNFKNFAKYTVPFLEFLTLSRTATKEALRTIYSKTQSQIKTLCKLNQSNLNPQDSQTFDVLKHYWLELFGQWQNGFSFVSPGFPAVRSVCQAITPGRPPMPCAFQNAQLVLSKAQRSWPIENLNKVKNALQLERKRSQYDNHFIYNDYENTSYIFEVMAEIGASVILISSTIVEKVQYCIKMEFINKVSSEVRKSLLAGLEDDKACKEYALERKEVTVLREYLKTRERILTRAIAQLRTRLKQKEEVIIID